MAMSMKELVAEARERIETVEPDVAHNGDGLILDVREPDEFETKGRAPGALNVPRGTLEMRADPESGASNERLAASRGGDAVYVMCASGGRAAMATDTLRRMGYDAKLIEGGMAGWEKAGLPVEGRD